jgi:hypothetical protein
MALDVCRTVRMVVHLNASIHQVSYNVAFRACIAGRGVGVQREMGALQRTHAATFQVRTLVYLG